MRLASGFSARFGVSPALVVQFLKFGVVGVIGFLGDTAVVYSLRGFIGLYAAGMVSYVIVATGNWALHRVWTFRGHSSAGRVHHQWMRFMVANLVGFVLNRGAYTILIATSALCREQPVLAVAGGAVAGMFVNFTLSKKAVFR